MIGIHTITYIQRGFYFNYIDMIKYKDICVEFPLSVHIWEVDFSSEGYLGGQVRD